MVYPPNTTSLSWRHGCLSFAPKCVLALPQNVLSELCPKMYCLSLPQNVKLHSLVCTPHLSLDMERKSSATQPPGALVPGQEDNTPTLLQQMRAKQCTVVKGLKQASILSVLHTNVPHDSGYRHSPQTSIAADISHSNLTFSKWRLDLNCSLP